MSSYIFPSHSLNRFYKIGEFNVRIEKWGELRADKKKLGELRAGCSVDMTAPGMERRYEPSVDIHSQDCLSARK